MTKFRELFETKNDQKALLDFILKDKYFKKTVKIYENYGDKVEISKSMFKDNKAGITLSIPTANIEVSYIPFVWEGEINVEVDIFENGSQIATDEFESMKDASDFVHNTFHT